MKQDLLLGETCAIHRSYRRRAHIQFFPSPYVCFNLTEYVIPLAHPLRKYNPSSSFLPNRYTAT